PRVLSFVTSSAGSATSAPFDWSGPRGRIQRTPEGSGRLPGRMAVERTLILAKPDAVTRGLAGEIVARFERRGLVLRAARLLVASRELGQAHYAAHVEQPFFGALAAFFTSCPAL